MFLGHVQSRDKKRNKSPRPNAKQEQKYSLETGTQKVNYILETVRLTQSQDSQEINVQFQCNIISPKDMTKNSMNPEIQSYQYNSPEWIAPPSIKDSAMTKLSDQDGNTYHNEHTYIRAIQQVQRTQIYSHSINGQQINSRCQERNQSISGEKVLQQNQFNFQNKNVRSSDEETNSIKSLQLVNKSHLVERILNKSSCVTLREIQQLQKIHDTQFQVFNEYGLKPNQCKRLQKIHNVQKVQLQQRYLYTKQNGGKIRKYSQAIPQIQKKTESKHKKLVKKSLSKQKKMLSSQNLLKKVNKLK